jgi:hypothetical protein
MLGAKGDDVAGGDILDFPFVNERLASFRGEGVNF